MEIKFHNVLLNNKEINIELNSDDIIGVVTNDKKSFLDLISLENISSGEIFFNDKKITKDNAYQYQRIISIVHSYYHLEYIRCVLDYMNYIIMSRNLKIKNPNKKIIDSLRIVGLDDSYLLRELSTLSSSEKILIQIASSLLSNPEVLVISLELSKLDLKNKKRIYSLLLRLKEQYHKIVIIVNDDSNIIYKYCTKGIIIKNGKVILSGKIKEIYARVDTLKRNKFDIPDIVMLTYKAKKDKKVKIDYHQDIRDIIKDIYKHV